MLFQNGWPLSCDVSAKGKMWKISLPCAWPLVPHRETLEDWPWKNRNAEGPLCSYLLFGSLNLDLSIHKAFFSLLRCYRSVFYSDYLTPGGSLSSFFQVWEDTNWSGILEAFLLCSFLGYLFILCFFGSYKAMSFHPQKTTQILLWCIPLTSHKTTVCHHWCTRTLLPYFSNEIHQFRVY